VVYRIKTGVYTKIYAKAIHGGAVSAMSKEARVGDTTKRTKIGRLITSEETIVIGAYITTIKVSKIKCVLYCGVKAKIL
jgi:hypothetical protein